MMSDATLGLIALILAALCFIGGLVFAYRQDGQTAAILIVVGAVLTLAGLP